MEREEYLKEQIGSYIDQLDLLGMQETLDQTRIDNVIATVAELASEYARFLDEQMELDMQAIEKRYVETLDEELQKRADILSLVSEKLASFSDMFSAVEEMDYAKSLYTHISTITERYQMQEKEYVSDVALVNDQIQAVADAEHLESDLRAEKTQAYVQVSMLKNRQVSYSTLDEEMIASYHDILEASNASSIDFAEMQQKKEALNKRQAQLLENLELARSAKDADGYVVTYEGRVKKNRIELDKIEEQKFLYFLGKAIEQPITSYESLQKRTESIQKLIQARQVQVKRLYQDGVITPEKYGTVSSKIDHTRIFTQLKDLETIKQKEAIIRSVDAKLVTTRDGIKGKEELEEIFAERAKARGRIAIIPEKPVRLAPSEEEPEILFGGEDEFEGYEELSASEVQTDKKRRQIVNIEPAKQTLLNKLGNIKNFLVSKLNQLRSIPGIIKEKIEELVAVPEEYRPSIGDQIQLLEGAMVYTNPMYAISGQGGVEASQAGLKETGLFVTRGAILDETGTPIYITSEYGVDLEAVAANMNLAPDAYTISLGCSIGDNEGKFIAVSDEELNSAIEKGWINATDPKLLVVDQLSKSASKGGMSK